MRRMATVFRPRTLVLFAGDLFFFVGALWLSLLLRAGEVPASDLFTSHLVPFSILFAVWVVIFFIAGLYEGRSIILARRALSSTLLIAQTFNVGVAALFFFYIPLFGIAPKTILFIYLFVSFPLILIWRAVIFPRLGLQKAENAVVVGERSEVFELAQTLAESPFSPARIVATINSRGNVAAEVKSALQKHHAQFVIADLNDPKISSAFPEMYNFLSAGIRFFDAMSLYETVFGRIPLSVLDDRWFARNVSRYAHTLYDVLKRFVDIVIAGLGGVVSLIFYPFIALAIKLEGKGPVFIAQERVGQDGHLIRIYKFRTMRRNEVNLTAEPSDNVVTAIGKILRVSRLDEIPQLWSVVKGDLSLIGPRPELPSGVALYEKEIPYYGVRHLIKPGLSGWAQLYHDNHPHHGADVEATREKLSYDLYYLKHRSLILDLIIVLKTLKKLLTRSGV
jgi:lipopolysaccharide/colanic/teichoic acid biosynthesis glycosyltransferase